MNDRKFNTPIFCIVLFLVMKANAHSGHVDLDSHFNKDKDILLTIHSINEDPYEFSRLSIIRHHGLDLLDKVISDFKSEKIKSNQELIVLNFAKNIKSFHALDDDLTSFVKQRYEDLFQNNVDKNSINGLVFFGDEESLSLMKKARPSNALFASQLDEAILQLDSKIQIDVKEEPMFSRQRSRDEREFLFCCAALTGGIDKTSILDYIKFNLNEDDLDVGFRLAEKNTLNLRPVAIEVVNVILSNAPKEGAAWSNARLFAIEASKYEGKYTQRAVKNMINKNFPSLVDEELNVSTVKKTEVESAAPNAELSSKMRWVFIVGVICIILLLLIFKSIRK